MKHRFILLDLGSGDSADIAGKDLASTNCPDTILSEISEKIKLSEYCGLPAEEEFLAEVATRGFDINVIKSLDNISMVPASADNY